MASLDRFVPGIQAAFAESIGAPAECVHIEAGPDQIPGWDSLGHVALVSSLETKFGVQFDIGELMELEDVRSIAVVLADKLALEVAA